jgi:hypothetical protein
MSLFVRVNCNFYTHRKTAKLRGLIGDSALWLPPRWWAYAAEHQPDGVFKNYSAAEIAVLVGYNGDADAMLQALLAVGFADKDPLRIHDWGEYNGYHKAYAERARKASRARWAKERIKENGTESEKRGEERSEAMLGASGSVKSLEMLGKAPLSKCEMVSKDKELARVNESIKNLGGGCHPTKFTVQQRRDWEEMHERRAQLMEELGVKF